MSDGKFIKVFSKQIAELHKYHTKSYIFRHFPLKLYTFEVDQIQLFDKSLVTLIYKLRQKMKKLLSIICASFLVVSTAKAEMTFGIGLMAGQVESSGTETEGTAADTSVRSKSFEEFFVGADLFVEKELPNGMSVGLSYVPVDVELGSGHRTDVDGNDAAENDDGTRSASADLSDLVTLYGNFPFGNNGAYGLAGVHYVTVSTSETLPNSSYGDEEIFGGLIGIGNKAGKAKIELFYSDFEDISISSTGGNNNKVEADADALTLRISIGF